MDAGNLVLNEEKAIGGKMCKIGTALAAFECTRSFSVDDVSKALQLGQLTVVPVAEKGKKKGKPGKPGQSDSGSGDGE